MENNTEKPYYYEVRDTLINLEKRDETNYLLDFINFSLSELENFGEKDIRYDYFLLMHDLISNYIPHAVTRGENLTTLFFQPARLRNDAGWENGKLKITWCGRAGYNTGRFGEELVYRELVAKFGKERVIWLNEGGETYNEYDFQILGQSQNILYYIDAKATTTGELSGDSVPIYIRPSEWNFMQKCKDNYILARVYNAKTSSAYVKYLKLGLQNWENITF